MPLYPGGWFGFFLYSKDGASRREPARALPGRYSHAAMHEAAFALPTWWRRLLPGAPAADAPPASPRDRQETQRP